MANRRMFSMQIVDSDAFLDMPQSSQLLYFHLAMRADDDGFVSNPRKIMRMVGASDDDYKILMAKRFILTFQSGIMVIKHWKINNYIQKDRYTETKYLDEKNGLDTKENGAYTERIQDVSKLDAQYSIGKDSIGKDSIGKDTHIATAFEEFWREYPLKIKKSKAYETWKKKMTPEDRAKCTPAIKAQIEAHHFRGRDNEDYIPHPTTWLNQRRWEDGVGSTLKKAAKPIHVE